MGWWAERTERRNLEEKLIRLAETHGSWVDPYFAVDCRAGLVDRDRKIQVGREVVEAMAEFQKMRDAGFVTKIDGVEVGSFSAMIVALQAAGDRPPRILRQWQH